MQDRYLTHAAGGFLAGGGEMGSLMRTRDWSQSGLGPVQEWPKSLLSTLSIILNSRFPMFLFWGPESICFYNDAYRPSLGENGKHPGILGEKAADYWQEIWEVIQPMIRQVMAGGEAVWREDQLLPIYRNGKMEDVYWTYSYSPVKDEDGNVGGVLVTCSETTAKVLAQKSIEDSNRKFLSAVMQAPVAICILKGPAYTVEAVNAKMLELWGKTFEEVTNKGLFIGVPEARGQGFEEILHQVYTKGKTYIANEVPVKLIRRGAAETLFVNFVYEPFYGEDRSVTGITAVATEVTDQVNAKITLHDTAERLQLATEAASMATWDLDLVTLDVIYSARLPEILGLPPGVKVTHTQMRDQLHREDRVNIVEKAFEEAMRTGIYVYEARIIHADHSQHWIRTQGKVVFDDNKLPLRMLGTIIDITAQRLAEEDTYKLAAIVESSGDAIISKLLDGTIVSWNDSAQRVFGYTAAEMIGEPIFKLIPPDRISEEPEIIRRLRKGERVEHFETQRLTKDGRLIDLSLTISPIRDHNGAIVGASKIARDISSQKQAERLISDNQERLKIVVEASELGTWEINLVNGDITYSDRYLDILGYPRGTVVSHEVLKQHLHPDDKDIRERAFVRAMETGVYAYEARLILNDKSVRWIEARGKALYDEQSRPVKLIGTVRDIHEERLSKQKIEESEKRFRMVADTAPVMIWMTGLDRKAVFLNRCWSDFTGLSIEEGLGPGWVEAVHPDDLEGTRTAFLAANEEKRTYNKELRIRRRDGKYRWVHDHAVPRYDASGIFLGYIGTSVDIHEQRDAKKELENKVEERTADLLDANEQLIRINQELEQFAYVSSHDLQEPLRKIQTFSEMLTSQLKEDANAQRYLEKINGAALRMSNLIADLLNYSQLSKTEQRFQKTDLNLILENICSDFEVLITQKEAVIESTVLPSINAIPIQMNQLFHNLVGNSLKFSDQHPLIRIAALPLPEEERAGMPELDQDQDYVHLTFSDNGIGFSQAHASQIFVIFQRLNDRQKYSGTGIGLAICKKIVENHHGHIAATSEPGNGATFHIYLPA